jgi:hypothetical protein
MTCGGATGSYAVAWRSSKVQINDRTYVVASQHALPYENAKAIDGRTADGYFHAVFGGKFPRLHTPTAGKTSSSAAGECS